jgi:uncharacterized protein (TIGR03437 family)
MFRFQSWTVAGAGWHLHPAAPPATITVTPGISGFGTSSASVNFVIATSPPSYAGLVSVVVTLTYTLPPPPVIHSIVNAASFQPGPLSPGEIVSIFGNNLCPLADATLVIPDTATIPPLIIFPTNSGSTTVSFVVGAGGLNAPILYCAGGQVNAVVPKQMAGQPSVNVTLAHYAVAAPTVSLPVTATTPAIFSANGQGFGQGAILNANSSVNSASNPAPKGSTVQIFAEGGGLLTPDELYNGQVANQGPPPVTITPVSVTIGGLPAQIAYAGQAPDQVAGVLQVNAVIPQNIGSGAQPVVLTVGANSNASQQITVAVQ